MALPGNADIPLILSRIRPNAAWSWRGGSYADPANLIWTDPVQVVPTQLELETEWTVIASEQSTNTTVRQAIKNDYLPLVGLELSALTNAQARTLLEICVYVLGGIGFDRKLVPPSKWQVAKELLES